MEICRNTVNQPGRAGAEDERVLSMLDAASVDTLSVGQHIQQRVGPRPGSQTVVLRTEDVYQTGLVQYGLPSR